MLKKLGLGLGLIILVLWVANTSAFIVADQSLDPKFLSHRGVHQSFSSKGVGNQDCTALLIEAPIHTYLENTISSMQAAFEAGANVVELDIHLTPGGQWAVFHDWTLDCRTDGTGNTRDTHMDALKQLDIGYGYTYDGGRTFPLRGTGIGQISSLAEVFEKFPNREFLINFKSNRASDGTAFSDWLALNPDRQDRVMGVYGGPKPVAATLAAKPGMKGYSRQSMKACLKAYALTGWSGHVPRLCRDTIIPIPLNYGKFLWGWPTKFEARFNNAGSTLILLGPHSKSNVGSTGVDRVQQLDAIPDGFKGYVWTNRIRLVGPKCRPPGK